MSGILCEIDADCETGYVCVGGRCVPDIEPDPGGGAAALPGLGTFLQKRYTSNVAITEQMTATDLIHDVLCPASRMYLVQAEYGKIGLKNKKPTPYAYATTAVGTANTYIDVDNVTDWIGNVNNLIIKAPHTTESEIREVTAAAYATDQNSITCSNTGGLLTTPNFSGYSAPSTPATSTFTVNSATAATDVTVTINGVVLEFTTNTGETTESIAAYLAGVISAHPSLSRKFTVAYTTGASTLTLTARTGRLTINAAFTSAVSAPLADPTTAPTLGGSGSDTTFPAGDYAVAYSAINAYGETLLSNYKVVSITANQHIDVSTVSLPSGATALRWYVSPTAGSNKLRYIAENNGASFDITTLPLLSAQLPPDLNRTGAEMMRVQMAFSDRSEARSYITASNVCKATFEWVLGNRESSINRVDLKYRDAAEDWRLVELRIRNDEHIAKTRKISPLSVNGQAINNSDQANRIAAGTLAERRDADFFYKWKATRQALLLQEGDVVAITDDGSGVYNLPVIIEQVQFDIPTAGLPFANFTARKYASNLYDDSIVERTIPVISEEYTMPTSAPIALLSNTSASTSTGNNVTTSAIDTSGAELLVLAVSYYQPNPPTISDSQGNTWTALTAREVTSGECVRFYYCASPSVTGSHTFTATSTSGFPSIAVSAWQNNALSPFDAQTGNTATSASTLTPGSITPSTANALVITALAGQKTSTSIGSSFTLLESRPFSGGVCIQLALAYILQTSAAAVNPTFTQPSSGNIAVAMAAFKHI